MLQFFSYNSLATLENSGIRLEQLIMKNCTNLIKFSKKSVGATENALIASCFAKGITKLRNCATEPEVKDLIIFLNVFKFFVNIRNKTKRLFRRI